MTLLLVVYLVGCALGLVLCGYYAKDGERSPEPLVVAWPILLPVALLLFVCWALTEFGGWLRRRTA